MVDWLKAYPNIKVPVSLEFLDLYCNQLTGGLAKAVYKKYGKEGLQLIEQVLYAAGVRAAGRLKERKRDWDVKAAGLAYAQIYDNWIGSVSVLEATKDRVLTTVPFCEYGCDNRELCDAMMALDRGIVETLHSDARISIEKSVSRGDDRCEVAVVRKK
jgi:hypothetical protein